MRAIIGVNMLGYIGLNDELPWKSTDDLKHFKKLTSQTNREGKPKLLVGYNTYSKLKSLPGRELILFNERNGEQDLSQIDWCIGGKKTYEKLCHLFTELHISYINDVNIGDTMFPDLQGLSEDCVIYRYNFEING